MELLITGQHFILKHGQHSLWCPRIVQGQQLLPRFGLEIGSEAKCLGVVYGLFGLFDHNKLILIQDRELVGTLPGPRCPSSHQAASHNIKDNDGVDGDDVYKVTKVVVIDLANDDENVDYGLDACPYHGRHQVSNNVNNRLPVTPKKSPQKEAQEAVQQTWNQIKSATGQAKAGVSSASDASSVDGNIICGGRNSEERMERKLIEEICKMMNHSDSFYYSLTGDLTNSVWRRQRNLASADGTTDKDKTRKDGGDDKESVGVKEKNLDHLDDRFFWNKCLIDNLINCPEDMRSVSMPWIIPIIQGYFESGTCYLNLDSGQEVDTSLILMSRRSRFRAGTRYKRRGVDVDGHVANYVETEQIIKYENHILSFVQVRGSIPLFWSQSGHSYRPPPVLERSEDDNFCAFKKHFNQQSTIYGPISVINLIESTGRESVLGDAFLDNVIKLNDGNICYISFDFHDYCRGMKFENVSILISNIHNMIKTMSYTWIDDQGFICEQSGVFRVNCVDCLDRTNVVQTALARAVLDLQLTRLGLLQPNQLLPSQFRRMFQTMWANNGDTISRQYAGTAALKSDFTRTGERKLAGMFKDSYNSATRYYKNRFRDSFRQAAIDVMQGTSISDALEPLMASPDEDSVDGVGGKDLREDKDHHERVKQVIEDCKRYLVPENEIILGGWPLIDADACNLNHSSNLDMDTVLILTKDCYFVAEYDDHTDRITRYQRVNLEDLEKIEFGPLSLIPSFSSRFASSSGIKRSSSRSRSSSRIFCIRFFYLFNGVSGYFHMFKPTLTRFFNNMVIPIRTPEEEMESLKAICESFKVALSVRSLSVPVFEGKLEMKKSKNVNIFDQSVPNLGGNFKSGLEMARNVCSDTKLIKTVGKSAISSFNKFKGKFSATKSGQESGSLNVSNIVPIIVSKSEDPKHSSSSSGDVNYDDEDIMDMSMNDESILSTSVFISNRRHQNEDGDDSEDNGSDLEYDDRQVTPIIDQDGDNQGDGQDDDDEYVSLPVGVNADNDLNNDEEEDAILESCGIINTGSVGGQRRSSNEGQQRSASPKGPVLSEVDDFVMDSIKKAGLRHLRRKASDCEDKKCINTNISTTIEDMTRSLQHLEPFLGSGNQMMNMSTSCAVLAPSQRLDQSINLNVSTFSGRRAEDEKKKKTQTSNNISIQGTLKNSRSETEMFYQHKNVGGHVHDDDDNCCQSSFGETPTMAMKKDLVMSPLSRIAKGVQNIGHHLQRHHQQPSGGSTSPNRGHHGHHRNNLDPVALQEFEDKKKMCKSKIIEL